ncbi:hypothetical protein GCM10029992_21050 [Glycomyces albus]
MREYLLEKWNRTCAYCGASEWPLQVEHIHPRARGGSDRVGNLTLACEPCNQAKGSRQIEEFLADRPQELVRILDQARTPLRDAAAMNATRWALWRDLVATGIPVESSSGGRTKYNRAVTGAAKSHTLDALHIGNLGSVIQWPATILVATATGRGSYSRTRTDAYGFPRLRLPRTKQVKSFQTGDLARATVPSGKRKGVHTGRVAVRSRGTFNVRTANGLVTDIHHRHFQLIQRADGYGYRTEKESGVSDG